MGSENVCLAWEGHHKTLIAVFEKLLTNSSFVDCTIVAEGQQLKAHKEVLCAFSPFFEMLLKEEYQKNPTIILDGFTYQELQIIIGFMYQGRATIAAQKVVNLIEVAQSLQIKGLGSDSKGNSSENKHEILDNSTKELASPSTSANRKEKSSQEERAGVLSDKSCWNFEIHSKKNSLKEVSGKGIASQHIAPHKNINSKEISVFKDQGIAGTSLPSAEAEKESNAESFVKTEDVEDDEVSFMESTPIKGVRKKNTLAIPCKRSKLNKETVLDGHSGTRKSDNIQTKPPARDLSSADVENTEIESSLANYSPLASTSKNELSCSSVDTEDQSSHSELILKSEPMFDDESSIEDRAEELTESTVVFAEALELRETMTSAPQDMMYSGASSAASEDASQPDGLQTQLVSGSFEAATGEGMDSTLVAPHLDQPSSASPKKKRRLPPQNLPRDPRLLTYYSCSECQKIFSQSFDLKVHMRIHTGEKPYKCKECDFTASHLGNLNRHQRIHSSEKPFKCDLCDFSAREYSNLKQHRKIHSGERPYACTECDFAAKRMSHLKSHQYVHSKERPFKCSECDFAGTRSNDLKVHQRIHTGEKPYKCTECDFAAARRSRLKEHQRVHTEEGALEFSSDSMVQQQLQVDESSVYSHTQGTFEFWN